MGTGARREGVAASGRGVRYVVGSGMWGCVEADSPSSWRLIVSRGDGMRVVGGAEEGKENPTTMGRDLCSPRVERRNMSDIRVLDQDWWMFGELRALNGGACYK